MGGVATPVVISGQSKLFRDNQGIPGQSGLEQIFGTLSGHR